MQTRLLIVLRFVLTDIDSCLDIYCIENNLTIRFTLRWSKDKNIKNLECRSVKGGEVWVWVGECVKEEYDTLTPTHIFTNTHTPLPSSTSPPTLTLSITRHFYLSTKVGFTISV